MGETEPSGGLASVTVMQSAHPRLRDNIAKIALVCRFDQARDRTILVEGSVAAISVRPDQRLRRGELKVGPSPDPPKSLPRPESDKGVATKVDSISQLLHDFARWLWGAEKVVFQFVVLSAVTGPGARMA
jgi:hypothetical protein